jgi:hypothetical protein
VPPVHSNAGIGPVPAHHDWQDSAFKIEIFKNTNKKLRKNMALK